MAALFKTYSHHQAACILLSSICKIENHILRGYATEIIKRVRKTEKVKVIIVTLFKKKQYTFAIGISHMLLKM